MDIEKVLKDLALEEKIALVSGTDFMYTNPIPRLSIPSLRMSDGPHGLRVQRPDGHNGVTGSDIATSFPTAATVTCSWNPKNSFKIGEAIGKEMGHYGIDIVLGPGVCIKRNPLCGRNFEYFSEDPLLSGKMGASEVSGIQSSGHGATVKHFALNNAENFRFIGDSVADERAMREIYLKSFEIVAKEGKPDAIMCAYNKINGEYCSENEWLLTDLLRKEWGFEGLTMSDWGATHDRAKGLRAGLDLEMPGDCSICRKWIDDALKDGRLEEKDLDRAVRNVLRLLSRYEGLPKGEELNKEKHDQLAAEIAIDSAVLLKNDGSLPLRKEEKVLVVGDMFEKMRYQGAGSSLINPTKLTSPKDAFEENGVQYVFAKGYSENETAPDDALIEEALRMADGYEKVLVFAGLTDYVESEGLDRKDMRLPANQVALLAKFAETGKKIILVLFGGSPVELPFADGISSILDMYLPGQNGGTAVYKLLFGLSCPSGKLAESWPKRYEDVPFSKDFSKTSVEVYKESVFVGYRYYLTAKKEVLYPFGYGLSYTAFEYSNMEVTENEDGFLLSCEVKNVGECDGAEVVELYVQGPKGVYKPKRELKGFSKVYLKAKTSKKVSIALKKEEMRYWNPKEKRWAMEGGEYELELCSDCQTVRLSKKVSLNGDSPLCPYPQEILDVYEVAALDKVTEDLFVKMSERCIPALPPCKPIRLESRFSDLRTTFMGRILYNAVLSVPEKEMRKAKRIKDPIERENRIKGAFFLKGVLESNSILSMTMSAGKGFPYPSAEAFVEIANGHIIKGIRRLTSKVSAPALPKEKK